MLKRMMCLGLGLSFVSSIQAAEPKTTTPALSTAKSTADLLKLTQPSDWRIIDPENLMVIDLASGRVVIELAPQFAPKHVANVRTLVRGGYFDGLAVMRAQDNYVVQWGDADEKREVKNGQKKLQPEFSRPVDPAMEFTPLPDADGWAAKAGFTDSWPVARDPKSGQTWLTHCYGMVGAGRDNAADSGSGIELYAMIATARQLDRNVTLIGRVVDGMPRFSVLPRGTGNLGFYEKPEQRHPIKQVKIAVDLPAAERPRFEVLRSDSAAFKEYVELRRMPRNEWFLAKPGYVDVCNTLPPIRPVAR